MKRINKASYLLLILSTIFTIYLFVGYLVPFSFNVNILSVRYHDMCAGEATQLVTVQRLIFPSYGIPANVEGELFFYDGDNKLETIIKRQIDFVYQKNDQSFTYTIEWNRPIVEPGEYGASDLITISPYPLIQKTAYFSEDQQRFHVIDCE